MTGRVAARFDRPVFIVSTPRSGSSLLFQTIAQAPRVYTVGGESHAIIEPVPGLHPRDRDWHSNRLTAADATPAVADEIAQRFYRELRDRSAQAPRGVARMIEKTPKNSLRVPFLDAIFPDAHYVYLHRDARATIASMIEAWRSGRFQTYPRLPGWPQPSWSLLLVPGWRDLAARPLPEIAARQWAVTTTILLDDLARLPAERVTGIAYDAFLAAPQVEIARLCGTLGIGWDRALPAELPLSPTVVSAPRADKWRERGEVERVWPIVAEVEARASAALAQLRR